MITITNIHYRDNHASLELDTGERLKLALANPVLATLSSGQSIDRTVYEQLKDESEHFECYSKALSYLAIRERSQREMKLYLKKKRFSENVISHIINHLKDKKHLNDYNFTASYINSTKNKRGIGKNLLKKKLLQKGVDIKIINKAIKELRADRTDPEQLYELAYKKYRSLLGKKNILSKLQYFLYQRGYDNDEIKQVLRRIKNEHKNLYGNDTNDIENI